MVGVRLTLCGEPVAVAAWDWDADWLAVCVAVETEAVTRDRVTEGDADGVRVEEALPVGTAVAVQDRDAVGVEVTEGVAVADLEHVAEQEGLWGAVRESVAEASAERLRDGVADPEAVGVGLLDREAEGLRAVDVGVPLAVGVDAVGVSGDAVMDGVTVVEAVGGDQDTVWVEVCEAVCSAVAVVVTVAVRMALGVGVLVALALSEDRVRERVCEMWEGDADSVRDTEEVVVGTVVEDAEVELDGVGLEGVHEEVAVSGDCDAVADPVGVDGERVGEAVGGESVGEWVCVA